MILRLFQAQGQALIQYHNFRCMYENVWWPGNEVINIWEPGIQDGMPSTSGFRRKEEGLVVPLIKEDPHDPVGLSALL